jgi:hypothetical protein
MGEGCGGVCLVRPCFSCRACGVAAKVTQLRGDPAFDVPMGISLLSQRDHVRRSTWPESVALVLRLQHPITSALRRSSPGESFAGLPGYG